MVLRIIAGVAEVARFIAQKGAKEAIKKYGTKLVASGKEFIKKQKSNPAKEKIDKGVKNVKRQKEVNTDFSKTELGKKKETYNFKNVDKKYNYKNLDKYLRE
tara:strand:- start:3221 stop:3526 length:306 start_codon:yes stop_codon:yes gene_type:complete